jgi:hypothetical protein
MKLMKKNCKTLQNWEKYQRSLKIGNLNKRNSKISAEFGWKRWRKERRQGNSWRTTSSSRKQSKGVIMRSMMMWLKKCSMMMKFLMRPN